MSQYSTANLILNSLKKTEEFGFLLGKLVRLGDIICLDGDLGAGKTTLTQAIARGMDVPAEPPVTSPSFAIFHEYQGRIPLYHFDLYRLHSSDEALAVGLEEYFYLSGCAVIEWSERAASILPEKRLRLELRLAETEVRDVFCQYHIQAWAARWRNLTEGLGISC
ncbi:MAG: tRNA (adenosine(37)-N6)-threonylcarbamoyltransferase complex ATPase subunit type 1 TsaE [Desulfobulbaceae bacterium]|jgi:tRNA threonylcarbamoyladenosine biosynthesis protein TsaE|nr:tRNA (adenosine(37)-N6)-threonylcarbamoyltransferase complex ATPase subunit type 1 TsaE [Desulfobulbaceae bacterium]